MHIRQNAIANRGATTVFIILAFLALSACTREEQLPATFTPNIPNPIQEPSSEPPSSVPAQTEYITFPDGTTTITIPGQIIGSSYKQYVLSGTVGQLLTIFVNADQPGVEISVVAHDGAVLDLFRSGYAYSKELEVSQNYYLNITPVAGAVNTKFSITVSISNLEQPDNLEQLDFSQDATSYQVNGKLYQNASKTYAFHAVQGQTLFIDITPANSGITISVRGVDGSFLGWVPAGISFSDVIPVTQEYFIDLVPPKNVSEINYEMVVSLQ